jgi:hypothetical protein
MNFNVEIKTKQTNEIIAIISHRVIFYNFIIYPNINIITNFGSGSNDNEEDNEIILDAGSSYKNYIFNTKSKNNFKFSWEISKKSNNSIVSDYTCMNKNCDKISIHNKFNFNDNPNHANDDDELKLKLKISDDENNFSILEKNLNFQKDNSNNNNLLLNETTRDLNSENNFSIMNNCFIFIEKFSILSPYTKHKFSCYKDPTNSNNLYHFYSSNDRGLSLTWFNLNSLTDNTFQLLPNHLFTNISQTVTESLKFNNYKLSDEKYTLLHIDEITNKPIHYLSEKNLNFTNENFIENLECQIFPYFYFPFTNKVKFKLNNIDNKLYRVVVKDIFNLTYFISPFIFEEFETTNLPNVTNAWIEIFNYQGLRQKVNCKDTLRPKQIDFDLDSAFVNSNSLDAFDQIRNYYFLANFKILSQSQRKMIIGIIKSLILGLDDKKFTARKYFSMKLYDSHIFIIGLFIKENLLHDINCDNENFEFIERLVDIVVEDFSDLCYDKNNCVALVIFINKVVRWSREFEIYNKNNNRQIEKTMIMMEYKQKLMTKIMMNIESDEFPIIVENKFYDFDKIDKNDKIEFYHDFVQIYKFTVINTFFNSTLNETYFPIKNQEVTYGKFDFKNFRNLFVEKIDKKLPSNNNENKYSINYDINDFSYTLLIEKISNQYSGINKNFSLSSNFSIMINLLDTTDKNDLQIANTNYEVYLNSELLNSQFTKISSTCLIFTNLSTINHEFCETWYENSTAICICSGNGLVTLVNDYHLTSQAKEFQFQKLDFITTRNFIILINIVFILPNLILLFLFSKNSKNLQNLKNSKNFEINNPKINREQAIEKLLTNYKEYDFYFSFEIKNIFFFLTKKINYYLNILNQNNELNIFLSNYDFMNYNFNPKKKIFTFLAKILLTVFFSILPFYFLENLDDAKEKIMNERKYENRFINIYDLPSDKVLLGISFGFCVISVILGNFILNFFIKIYMFGSDKNFSFSANKIENKILVKMFKMIIKKFSKNKSDFEDEEIEITEKLKSAVKKIIFMNRFIRVLKKNGLIETKNENDDDKTQNEKNKNISSYPYPFPSSYDKIVKLKENESLHQMTFSNLEIESQENSVVSTKVLESPSKTQRFLDDTQNTNRVLLSSSRSMNMNLQQFNRDEKDLQYSQFMYMDDSMFPDKEDTNKSK